MTGRNPFDFLTSINQTKEDLLKDKPPEEEKEYNPFLINRGLSYFPETVLIANEMNRLHKTDNKMQYDFLRSIVRKKKRFTKWCKPERETQVKTIMEYYSYTRPKAEAVLDMHSEEQISKMGAFLKKGGKSKKL